MLTRDNAVSIAGIVLAGLLTALVHVGIREWYKPDVRYQEGPWYQSSDMAVASLTLTNYGHADAEQIRTRVTFDQPIVEVTTSDPGLPFRLVDALNKKTVQGNVERLVAGDTLTIYFAVKNPDRTYLSRYFVTGMVFNGGIGKTGTPRLPKVLSGLLQLVLTLVVIGVALLLREDRKSVV